MKKCIYSLFALILLMGFAHAAPTVIHLQKGDKHIDLFGTIHMTKPDYFPLPTEVTNALKQADILAVELDMTDAQVMQETMILMATLSAKPGETVKNLLNDADYQKFKSLAGASAGALETLQPWVAANALSVSRAEQLGLTDKSVDDSLINLAKSQQIPVQALETVNEQLDAFSDMPIAEEKQFLQAAIGDDFLTEMDLTLKIWENRDEAAAASLLQKMQELPYLYQDLLVNRNKNMAKRIFTLNQDNARVYVAIGALHLYGADSVVQMLLDAGYREK